MALVHSVHPRSRYNHHCTIPHPCLADTGHMTVLYARRTQQDQACRQVLGLVARVQSLASVHWWAVQMMRGSC